MNEATLQALMTRAVRVAARGHGGAEPNPMVGCVIARDDGAVVAEGYHARCGGPHAEAAALAAAGTAARGATAVVTLEPCNHQGRTGPCSEALARAGVVRVVYAVSDPNPMAAGGAAHLRAAGIEVRRMPHEGATELASPFLKRITRGLPWIAAKWAQSIDGRTALSSGESQWISSPRSRALVHRERGRVDAVMTGIGTVLADDPRLTARGVRVQRVARRIVLDPACETPPDAHVCDGRAPTTLLVAPDLDARARARRAILAARGIEMLELGEGLRIEPAMRALGAQGVSTVLVESGGGLTGRLMGEGLIDEAWVFVGPLVIGDEAAPGAVRGLDPRVLAEIPRARLLGVRRRGPDVLLHYRWTAAPVGPA